MFIKVVSIEKWDEDKITRDARGRFAPRGGDGGQGSAKPPASTNPILSDTVKWVRDNIVSSEGGVDYVRDRWGRQYRDIRTATPRELADIRRVAAKIPPELLKWAAPDFNRVVVTVSHDGGALQCGNLVIVPTEARGLYTQSEQERAVRHELTHALIDRKIIDANGGGDAMWKQMDEHKIPKFLHAQRLHDINRGNATSGIREVITMTADLYESGDTLDAHARKLVERAAQGYCRVEGRPRRKEAKERPGRPLQLNEAKNLVRLWRQWTKIGKPLKLKDEDGHGFEYEEGTMDKAERAESEWVASEHADLPSMDEDVQIDLFRSQCFVCRNSRGIEHGQEVCLAFPDGIPNVVLHGITDHRRPIDGDGGVHFQYDQEIGMSPQAIEGVWPFMDELLCWNCQHLSRDRVGMTCRAFRGPIPDAILNGRADHRSPYPGDNGITFGEQIDRVFT